MNKRILVVDDEAPIQRFLKPALAASGYDVLTAENGRQALHLIATGAPDLIVLDLGLPDMDGKEVLEQARQFSQAPVIVLSARDREAEKIAALDLGADDYVEKPFAIGEFMARLRAALRHAARNEKEILRFDAGGLSVDLERRLVSREGASVKLTPKEFDLLAVLVRHAGKVVTHRQILAQVWGPAHVEDTQYLRVFVGQLRAKIEPSPDAPRLIQTEAGVGYRLCGGE
ncbi:two-component system KDP operon response regulator KdpE [Rhodoblastus acidophilus]|uniref:response regulator n=1 Tax=Rhodoblastus acidophilus TaxID=1074 RepID=UPI002224793F|nr:response regulator transcription factor [Rhodoblastus acidophilus]MCW2286035.1 two-component system KDP operon response regulator KdpE [Rhodoblastus acidophilus]MCW2334929.1 two-component system KDP operon response regulator KdpE [Rhodoblastus acidophilus]